MGPLVGCRIHTGHSRDVPPWWLCPVSANLPAPLYIGLRGCIRLCSKIRVYQVSQRSSTFNYTLNLVFSRSKREATFPREGHHGQQGFLILPLGFQVQGCFQSDFFFRLPPCDLVSILQETLLLGSISPKSCLFPLPFHAAAGFLKLKLFSLQTNQGLGLGL